MLADRALAIVVRDILETCKRFTGLIERWGGDVLPDLLVEGASGEELGAMVKERSAIVRETAEVRDSIYLTHMRLTSLGPKNLDELISDFFRMLLALQNPSSVTGDASSTNAGVSLSRTARAVQMMQSSRVMSRQTSFSAKKTAKSGLDIEKEERDLEGDALMGRHIEQRKFFASPPCFDPC